VLFCTGELARARRRRSSALQFAFSVAQFLPRTIEKVIARYDSIDQSQLQSFLCGIKLSLCDYFRSFFGANQPRQPSAAAPTRNKAQCRFGKTDPRGRIIRGNAVIARQRNLVAATSGCTVDCRDSWNFQFCEPIQNALPVSDERPHIPSLRLSQ